MKTRKLDQLESFEHGQQVLNLLAFQPSFIKFLMTIKAINGASILVHNDGETSIGFNGKPINGTKKERFNDKDELIVLLDLAGLI